MQPSKPGAPTPLSAPRNEPAGTVDSDRELVRSLILSSAAHAAFFACATVLCFFFVLSSWFWSVLANLAACFVSNALWTARRNASMLAAVAPFSGGAAVRLVANEPDKVLAFKRGKYLFAFNFNPTKSFEGYGILVPPATEWKHLFDTDEVRFGGQGRIGRGAKYGPALVPWRDELVQQIRLYLPARTAVVLIMV